MNEISERQKNLLEWIEKGICPLSELVERLTDFFRTKLEDEPLSPDWVDFWNMNRDRMVRFLPSSLSRRIDEELKSIEMVNGEIWDIRVNNGTRITFLLGAGSSAPSGIPTVDKLLLEMWKRARKIGRDDLDRLAEWCNKHRIMNIEDLLTAAYISNFAAKNRNITSLLDYFLSPMGQQPSEEEKYLLQRRRPVKTLEMDVSAIGFLQDTLQTLFGLLTSTMISANPNPTHNAIVNFIRDHKNTSIITTNYDGCMDQAILEAGLRLKRTIAGENEEGDIDAVELVKMHGSINWSYCESCQDVREFDLLKLKDTYEKDELSYPVMGICKNCGGMRRPLLVPPLSFKFLMFPNLVDIWNSARQSIEESDYLIIVGYSFSEADTYITKIISRSMTKNKNQKMIIVNTDSKLVRYLRERFQSRVDGFDRKRILQACKNCEEILPEILDSMLGKRSGEKENKSTRKSTKKKVRELNTDNLPV